MKYSKIPAGFEWSRPARTLHGARFAVKILVHLIGACALALALGGTALAQETVRIATEGSYPPWNATDSDGTLIGFDIDVGNALCERMGVTCEWVPQQWDGIIVGLLAGHYDLIISSMSITNERRKRIAFSDAYVTDPVFFVAAADSELQSATTLEEVQSLLVGKAVGVQTATVHANFLQQYLGDTIEMRLYDTQDNIILDLASGRIDAGLAHRSSWQAFLQTEDGAGFDTFGPPLTGSEYPVLGEGTGIGIRKEDTKLLAMVNEVLAAMKADGTMKALSEKWFGYDITMY
jgi:octopine/nopaline transport system substrate-binding protein